MTLHPPKVETFDVEHLTNTDPKGFVRAVDEYREEPWGLYMARSSDHPSFHYLESWLIPELGLRASIFHYVPERARDQDYYIDVGEFSRAGSTWTSVDHYLDIVVRTGQDLELLDVDELLNARVLGLLEPEACEKAIVRATTAVDGIASHGHDMDAWFASLGMPTTWR